MLWDPDHKLRWRRRLQRLLSTTQMKGARRPAGILPCEIFDYEKSVIKKGRFPSNVWRRLHQPVAVEMQQQAWPMLPDHSNSRSFDWQNRWPNVGPYIRALIVPPKKGGARLSKCHERSRSELHRAQTPDPLHLQWLSTPHLSQSNVGLSEQILGKTPNSNGLSWIIMQFQILICYSHF
jgi:hypothetical protein